VNCSAGVTFGGVTVAVRSVKLEILNVSHVDILHGMCSSELTFENFFKGITAAVRSVKLEILKVGYT